MNTLTNSIANSGITLQDKIKSCNTQIDQFVRLTKRKMSFEEKKMLLSAWESVSAYKQMLIGEVISLQNFIKSSLN